MQLPRLRAGLALLLLVALTATACGSSSDTTDATTPPAEEAEAAAPAAQDDSDSEPDGAANDAASAAAGDGAANDPATDVTDLEPEPADIRANTVTMTRALFNVDPDAGAVECIVAEGERLPGLGEALAGPSLLFSDFGDAQLKDVAYGINGCVDSIGLGGWATDAVGPSGEVRELAPACFAERFDNPDNGDGVFHTFIALSFQYRYDPEFVDATRESFVTCTPISGLSELFADGAEADANFAITIDRDCFDLALSDPGVSEDFWGRLIDGIEPPINALDASVKECTLANDAESEVPTDFEPWAGTGALASVTPASRANVYSEPPPMTIDQANSYEAVFTTGGGEIRIRLMPEHAPITVNNFVSLARDGYFDGTVFHRVLDEFMAQGGDPTGTGTGGPGYSFGDEFEGGPALDKPGLLAMANSGPATNGSQFFITFVATEWLTGNHTVFGEVIEGQELVDAIERRDPGGPTRGQILETVVIVES